MVRVLVTGGAGYIGSHTAVELLDKGYEIVIADNLSNSNIEVIRRIEKITGKKVSFEKVELCNLKETEELFKKYPDIDSVIHFAGLKAVGESVQKSLEYYYNNLVSTLNVLKVMKERNINKFVFSSSATVYGKPKQVPIKEDDSTGGTTNPYGTTKLFLEKILIDYQKANPDLNVAILRYFNPIGAHESGLIGEDPSGIPNNLVPYIAQVAIGKLSKLHIYGNDYDTKDGTGVRDYIHVVDLAKGHIKALEKLKKKPGMFIVNLGTGKGYSVLDVLNAYQKACGKKLPYVIDKRRPGDIDSCYADTQKAFKKMNWKAELGIDEMCESSYNWQKKNPNGYKK